MLRSSSKVSPEGSDEDCDELVSRRKKPSGPPSCSAKSPYLCSLNVSGRRAWRPARASPGGRAESPGGGGSARISSLLGHDVTLRSEVEVTPELLKQTLSLRKFRHVQSTSNGFSAAACDSRDKEDMYEEILRLKKSLQAQKSDNHQMKARLRRLEEDNVKREKQIEELLDPTKGSEYTLSLVDKRREGSVVVSGLKQRVLKLERQCREKEKALSNLQSDLRTSSLEELKITAETYFQEIQRLRIHLEAAEKSSRAESKCSQRQQRALSSTVRRLSDSLKQLQQENAALREELDTERPAAGGKGYRQWSKHRLLRRLLELEKLGAFLSSNQRLQDSRSPASPEHPLDRGVQATPEEAPGFTMATEAVVSMETVAERRGEGEEVFALRKRLDQSEKEKEELHQALSRREEELEELRTEKAELETKAEQQEAERLEDKRRHQREMEELREKIQTLEEERGEEEEEGGDEARSSAAAAAAALIQAHWRKHRDRDVVMLQAALRAHLLREALLRERPSPAHPQAGAVDVSSLTVVQAAFRGHLARRRLTEDSSWTPLPGPPEASRKTQSALIGVASSSSHGQEDSSPDSLSVSHPVHSRTASTGGQTELRSTAAAVDSDDSDDIVMSPSRPLRSRELLMA